MGFIEKRGGRWRARYRGPDGQERSRTFDRKTDAEKWLSTSAADVVRGEWTDPKLGRMTFAEWCKKWEAGLHDLRPTTKALNIGVVRNHLLPRFGDWPLARITTAEVKTMVSELMDEPGRSVSSIRRHVLVLGSVLGAAVEDGRLARNAARGVRLPTDSARPMRYLTAEELIRVANAAGDHYRPMILTAGFVGLRYGELAGLRVERVNLLRRTIRIEEQLVEVGGRVFFGPPKTRAGVRTVTIPAFLSEVLGAHFGTPPVVDSGMAFPTIKGKLLRRANFATMWRKARTRAGFDGGPLDGLVFHELRHTAVALAVKEGAHPLAIKERLGHASITTTLDTYGGLFPSLDEAISEGLDRQFSEALAASPRPEGEKVERLRRSEG